MPATPVYPRAYLALLGEAPPFKQLLYDATGAPIQLTPVQEKHFYVQLEKPLKTTSDGPEIDGKAYVILGVPPLHRTFRLMKINHFEEELDANIWAGSLNNKE